MVRFHSCLPSHFAATDAGGRSPAAQQPNEPTTPCTSFCPSSPAGVAPTHPPVDDFGSGIGGDFAHPAGRVRPQGVGRHDRRRPGDVDLAAPGQGGAGGRRRRSADRPDAAVRSRRPGPHHHRAGSGSAAPLSPQHGPPPGGGGPRAVPGHPMRDRTGPRRRLLLRLRRAAALRPRGSGGHRAADARDRGARPALRPRAAPQGGRQGVLRGPRRAAQGAADRGEERPDRVGLRHQGRLPRLLRRPARAVGRQARPLQAAVDVERLLEGRREEPADAARLRHRLLLEGRARAVPEPPRGSQEARPPQAGQGPRPLPLPPVGARARRSGWPRGPPSTTPSATTCATCCCRTATSS